MPAQGDEDASPSGVPITAEDVQRCPGLSDAQRAIMAHLVQDPEATNADLAGVLGEEEADLARRRRDAEMKLAKWIRQGRPVGPFVPTLEDVFACPDLTHQQRRAMQRVAEELDVPDSELAKELRMTPKSAGKLRRAATEAMAAWRDAGRPEPLPPTAEQREALRGLAEKRAKVQRVAEGSYDPKTDAVDLDEDYAEPARAAADEPPDKPPWPPKRSRGISAVDARDASKAAKTATMMELAERSATLSAERVRQVQEVGEAVQSKWGQLAEGMALPTQDLVDLAMDFWGTYNERAALWERELQEWKGRALVAEAMAQPHIGTVMRAQALRDTVEDVTLLLHSFGVQPTSELILHLVRGDAHGR